MGVESTLVYVDDEKDLLEIFEILNSSLPVSLKTFNDPNEGLDFINTFPETDKLVVFCDVTMPKMNGIKLKGLIEKEVDFYFVTADALSNLKDVDKENILSKPLSPETVEEICNKHFSK